MLQLGSLEAGLVTENHLQKVDWISFQRHTPKDWYRETCNLDVLVTEVLISPTVGLWSQDEPIPA